MPEGPFSQILAHMLLVLKSTVSMSTKKHMLKLMGNKIRGEFSNFVECGIFLYNSRFLFTFLCSVNLCHLNDNSHSVNAGSPEAVA